MENKSVVWFLLLVAFRLSVVVTAASDPQAEAADTALPVSGTLHREELETAPSVRSLRGFGVFGPRHFGKGGHRFQSCTRNLSVCSLENSGGSTCCSGVCCDIGSSVYHCGKCGRSCGFRRSCCNGECTDTLNDPNNCGSCGQECFSSEYCFRGLCNYNGV